MKSSNVWAFLGGAAAGAIIALLTTPRNGEENRKLITDKVKSGTEYTKKELQNLISRIKEKVQDQELLEEIEDLEVEIAEMEERC